MVDNPTATSAPPPARRPHGRFDARTAVRRAAPFLVAACLLLLGYLHYAPGADYSLSAESYRAWAFPSFQYSDLIWLHLRDGQASHPIPYVDFPLEYPPLTGLVTYLLSFAPTLPAFFALAYLLLAASALGTVAVLTRLPGANPWWYAAAPALFFYTGHQWDGLAVFVSALSLLAIVRGHGRWGAIGLTAAVWLKLFPLAFLAAVVIDAARRRRWREVVETGTIFALGSVLINLPFALANWNGWSFFFRWNRDRLADAGIWVLWRDLPTAQVTTLSLALAVAGGLALAALALLPLGPWRSARGPMVLPLGAVMLLWWLVANKTFTTHLVLWVFLALALLRVPGWLWAGMVVVDVAAFQLGNFLNLPNVSDFNYEPLILKAVFYLYDPLQLVRTALLLAAIGWGILAVARIARPVAVAHTSDRLAPGTTPVAVPAVTQQPSNGFAHATTRESWAIAWTGLRRTAGQIGLVAALYAGATVVLTWPYAVHLADATVVGFDPLLQIWLSRWVQHALATNPLGLYEANIFHPFAQTLAYTDANVPGALLALPLDLLTGDAVVTNSLLVLASFVLAALGMCALVGHLTGNRAAAFLAGLAYAFIPYRIVHLWHLNWLQSAWLPWLALALLRLIERPTRGRAVVFGLLVAVQTLTSFYFAVQIALLGGAILAACCVARRQWPSWRLLGALAIAAGLAALLTVPFYLPYLRVRAEQRLERTLTEAEHYKATGTSYLTLPPWDAPNPLQAAAGVRAGVNDSLLTVGQAPHADGHSHPEIVIEDALFPGTFAAIGAAVAVMWVAGRRRGLRQGVPSAIAAPSARGRERPTLNPISRLKPAGVDRAAQGNAPDRPGNGPLPNGVTGLLAAVRRSVTLVSRLSAGASGLASGVLHGNGSSKAPQEDLPRAQSWKDFVGSARECIPANEAPASPSASLNSLLPTIDPAAGAGRDGRGARAPLPLCRLARAATSQRSPTATAPSPSNLLVPTTVALIVTAAVAGLLSLGPSWGPRDGSGLPLPYRFLFDHVPFFTAMRVPARLGGLVDFALVALAGIGAAVAWTRLRRWPIVARRPALVGSGLTALLALGLLIDLDATPVPLETIDRGAEAAAVYEWLAAQPDDGAVMEFPAESIFADPAGTSVRRHVGLSMYWSTLHWKPLVNGNSGFIPRAYSDMVEGFVGQILRPDGTLTGRISHVNRKTAALLHQLGVRYLIFHRSQYRAEDWSAVVAQLDAAALDLERVGDFGEATVYRVLPPFLPPPAAKLTLYAPTLLTPDSPWAPFVAVGKPGDRPSLLSLTEPPMLTATWYDRQGKQLWRGERKLPLPVVVVDEQVLCSLEECEAANDAEFPTALPAPAPAVETDPIWRPTEPGHYVVRLTIRGDPAMSAELGQPKSASSYLLDCKVDLDLVEDAAAVAELAPDDPFRWAECVGSEPHPVNNPGAVPFRAPAPSIAFVNGRLALEATLTTRRDEEVRGWFLLAPPGSATPWLAPVFQSTVRQRLVRAGEPAEFDWLEPVGGRVEPGVYGLTVWFHRRTEAGWEHAHGGGFQLPSVIVDEDGRLRWAGPIRLMRSGILPAFRPGETSLLRLMVSGASALTRCEASWRLVAPADGAVVAHGNAASCERPRVALPQSVAPGRYRLEITATAVRDDRRRLSDGLTFEVMVTERERSGWPR